MLPQVKRQKWKYHHGMNMKRIDLEVQMLTRWELLQATWLLPTLHGPSAAAWCGRCRSKSGPGLPPGTGKSLPPPQRLPHRCAPHWPLSALLGWMSICEHINERVSQLGRMSSPVMTRLWILRVCEGVWLKSERKKKVLIKQIHVNVNSQADDKSECIDLRPHRLPLGYWTTMSWSSSMPHTVPVVVSVSNMPSVHPPWPCWRDWTISRSKSMLTRSPIWRPPGFRFPFCSPGRLILQKKIASDFKWFEMK